MQIQVKLMGALRSKSPPGAQGGRAQIELPAGSSVINLLELLGVTSSQIHLVMVNGEMDRDRNRILVERDEVVIFPPVAGGCS